MRNYKKERENYHSRPEQMIRNAARKRARRQMEKAGIAKRFDGKDIHHKDNNPENNDLNIIFCSKPPESCLPLTCII